MKYELLRPDQIITLRDYPLHNEQILKIYFRVFSKNQAVILPPCPVIHKSLGVPYAQGKDIESLKYNKLLSDYMNNNPYAEYFLLDGSHKTTAATLSHKQIPAVLIEEDRDFLKAKELIETGEFFGWYAVDNSIEDALSVLTKHHIGTDKFQTVEDKTKLMISNKDVPDYMISFFHEGAL